MTTINIDQGASGANPTATASDVAVNGSAATFMRSDGAPAVQKTSASVFGLCKVDGSTITASGGVITAVPGGGGVGNVTGPGSSTDTAIATWNGTAGTALRNNFATAIDASGNISTTGKLVVTGNVSGGNLTTAGNVTGANIGNITPTNFDGNSSHVLLGNGSFGISPSGGGGAMTLISSTSTTGNVSSVTISSIPSSYTHLELILMGRGSTSATGIDIQCQFNGDTAGNYYSQLAVVNNNTFSGADAGNATSIRLGDIAAATAPTGFSGAITATFAGYAQTTFAKAVHAESGRSAGNASSSQTWEAIGGLWNNTAAINAVKVFPSAGAFVDGTIVSLYGLS